MDIKPISPKLLTVYYVAALLILAVLSVASHFVLYYGLNGSAGSAAATNVSGRQRMLSQRITALSAELALGDESVRPDLRAAVDEFEDHYNQLVSRDSQANLGSVENEVHDLFFNSTTGLDPMARDFIADARQVATLPRNDPTVSGLTARIFMLTRGPLLTKLNEVVALNLKISKGNLAKLQALQWGILILVLLTLIGEAFAIFRPLVRRIVDYTAKLLTLATTDALTGAANRRHFIERGMNELARMKRYDRPLTFLMLDADHFKSINDTHGHIAGDKVLQAIGAQIPQMLRETDIWARIGGEEFAVLLVETDLNGANLVAERIRAILEKTTVDYHGKSINFSVSIGVSSLHRDDIDLGRAMSLADKLLYRAKAAGRNCVISEAATTRRPGEMSASGVLATV